MVMNPMGPLTTWLGKFPQDAEDRVVEMVRLPYGYRIEEPSWGSSENHLLKYALYIRGIYVNSLQSITPISHA